MAKIIDWKRAIGSRARTGAKIVAVLAALILIIGLASNGDVNGTRDGDPPATTTQPGATTP